MNIRIKKIKNYNEVYHNVIRFFLEKKLDLDVLKQKQFYFFFLKRVCEKLVSDQ